MSNTTAISTAICVMIICISWAKFSIQENLGTDANVIVRNDDMPLQQMSSSEEKETRFIQG